MLEHARALLSRGFERLGLRVERIRPRPTWAGEQLRLDYQARYVTFPIAPGDRVLDVGSGGYPFPLATVHLDRYPAVSPSRHEPLAPVSRPFVTGDLHHLPFRDQSFDFIYASHVLQSVDDPIRACAEMMRVGKAGFIETPTIGKSALFSWAKGLMKWYAVGIHRHFCFFEYSDRELEGVRSPVWRNLIMSRWYEPLQGTFYDNQDVFNVLFSWTGSFSVFVFALDGSVRTLNAPAALNPRAGHMTDSEPFAELTTKAQRS
jgi:SAM-dependent methyltransferase